MKILVVLFHDGWDKQESNVWRTTIMIYTMSIETADGVKTHGFHLGTDFAVAKSLVFAQLRRASVRSVSLKHGHELIRIYDFRDLEDAS